MARPTFFGEVLPVLSRAVDEDDDDDESNGIYSQPELRLSAALESSGSVACDKLVIAVGPVATLFAQSFLLGDNAEELGSIVGGLIEQEGTGGSQLKNKTSHIYRSKCSPDVIIVLCDAIVFPEHTFPWTELLFSTVDSTNTTVTILASSSFSDFKVNDLNVDLQPPFLRALKTPKFDGVLSCPYLEQPNTVPGLPAQLLGYCCAHDIPAVLYQCYMESMYYDADTVMAYEKLLKDKTLQNTMVENPHRSELIARQVDSQVRQSPMYI